MKEYLEKQANLNSWANNILRETMRDFTKADLETETPYG